MFIICGKVKGISAHIKNELKGVTDKDIFIERIPVVKDALRSCEEFPDDADDDMTCDAMVAARLLPSDNEYSLSRIHDSILTIYTYFLHKESNRISEIWKTCKG